MNPNDKFFLWALTAATAGLPFGCAMIVTKAAQPRMQGIWQLSALRHITHQHSSAGHTVIVLWADYGYHLGDKASCVKFTLWEKANHVPFIIVDPGVTQPGSRVDTPVSVLDTYPTLLELAGLPPEVDNDGESLVPMLKDPSAKR